MNRVEDCAHLTHSKLTGIAVMDSNSRFAGRSTNGIGYNGELHEPVCAWQFLGNGYRIYNPVLMRFHSSDLESPFGVGGSNAYAYCAGDPVNYVDPTGRFFQHLALLSAVGAVAALGGSIALGQAGNERAAEIYAIVAGGLTALTLGAVGIHALNRSVWPKGQSAAELRRQQNKVDIEIGEMTYYHGDKFDTAQVHGAPYMSAYKRDLDGAALASQLPASKVAGGASKPLRLESCYAGNGGFASTAQRLADKRRNVVYAPKGAVGNSGSGNGSLSWQEYRAFIPQRDVAKAATAAAHAFMHRYALLYHHFVHRDAMRAIRIAAKRGMR